MSNVAKDIIVPPKRVFRIVFLYVGQGASTLLVIPDGNSHKYALVDSHQDDSFGGIDLVKFFKDLFRGERRGLDAYINTHPHKDHLGAIKTLFDEVGIGQVWHSGHKPGKDHKEAYEELEYVMKKLGDENIFVLKGSRDDNKLDDKAVTLGDITYNVLAPAEYVADDIEDEDAETRYRRIHEQCGVIRFRYGRDEKQVLIAGDSDRTAWEKHITDYHRKRLPATVLGASHHGSNTFFWDTAEAEGEPFKDHLDTIAPTYVIVSAPRRKESPHGHPHKEALGLYEEQVGTDNVYHLGKDRTCVLVDINEDGDISVRADTELIEKYGISEEETESSRGEAVTGPTIIKNPSKPWCG